MVPLVAICSPHYAVTLDEYLGWAELFRERRKAIHGEALSTPYSLVIVWLLGGTECLVFSVECTLGKMR